MAAAVAMHLELEIEEAGEFSFDPGGVDVPSGRDNLIVRAFESLHPADGIAFRLREGIPLARGLGSSAAAIVAGLYAADHLFELALSREELLVRATEIEGHPDNVAAAIYGGFVICGDGDGGAPSAARFDPPDGLEGDRRDPRRGGLDRARPRGDPGRGPARRRRRQRLRRLAAGARAAQRRPRPRRPRPRRPHPPAAPARRSTRARWSWSTRPRELGALGATISGAGPTVLVWTTWQDAGKVAEALEGRASGWAEVRRLPFTPLRRGRPRALRATARARPGSLRSPRRGHLR